MTQYQSGTPWTGTPNTPPPPKKSRTRAVIGIIVAVVALVVAALAIAVVAVGSASNDASSKVSTPTVVSPTEPDPTGESDLPTPSSEPESGDNSVAKIGDTIKYENGIEVKVIGVKRVSFSDTSYGSHGKGLQLSVQIRNSGSEVFDPTLATVQVTYGGAGQAADEVFDTERGFNGMTQAKIVPGKTGTSKLGFAVPKSETQISVQVTPDFSSETAIFEGTVA